MRRDGREKSNGTLTSPLRKHGFSGKYIPFKRVVLFFPENDVLRNLDFISANVYSVLIFQNVGMRLPLFQTVHSIPDLGTIRDDKPARRYYVRFHCKLLHRRINGSKTSIKNIFRLSIHSDPRRHLTCKRYRDLLTENDINLLNYQY